MWSQILCTDFSLISVRQALISRDCQSSQEQMWLFLLKSCKLWESKNFSLWLQWLAIEQANMKSQSSVWIYFCWLTSSFTSWEAVYCVDDYMPYFCHEFSNMKKENFKRTSAVILVQLQIFIIQSTWRD